MRYREYNNDNLEDIIRQFLTDNDVKAKDLRFNFFLDRQIYNYLRWASLKTGKAKAKILRELVQDSNFFVLKKSTIVSVDSLIISGADERT